MIDLAPHNPYGLQLRSPVIVAPGCAAASRDLDPTLIGAIATRTATLHTTHSDPNMTHGAPNMTHDAPATTHGADAMTHGDPKMTHIVTHGRWGVVPAGVVFRRLPTVRFRSLAQAEAKRWARSSIPILLSVTGSADELAVIAAQLETLEAIAGVLIDAHESSGGRAQAVAAVRDQTALPILALLESPAG
jgi:hypothetical protein